MQQAFEDFGDAVASAGADPEARNAAVEALATAIGDLSGNA